MRTVLLTAEIVGTTLLMLALAAPPARAQTLGEVTTATGIHGTLSRQSMGSSRGTLDTVKRSLASSTKPRDYGLGASSSGFGAKSGPRTAPTKRTPSRSSGGSPGSGGHGRGSWVTADSTPRGNASAAWLQGGSGWATGGGGSSPTKRRPRS